MTNEDWDRALPLIERGLRLIEKWIDRKYPEQKVDPNDATVWKKGESLPEPQSPQEYRDFPLDQPGRFERAIRAARSERASDDDSLSS